MTFILFILVLLVTVLIHEWGHFWTAKKFGMLVEEFGFGIPPRLWSFTKGETKYSINALPFGGFVKIAGENGEEVYPAGGGDPTRQFEAKPWYAKSIVLVAGVVANIFLAIVLFTVSYMIGVPSLSENGTPTVLSVTKDSPVERSGIAVGDTIVSISKNGALMKEISTEALRDFINKETTPLSITVQKKDTVQTIIVTPEKANDGVLVGISVERISTEKLSFGNSFTQALDRTWFVTKAIFETVGQLLASLFGGEKVGGLVGPVGLAQEVRHASSLGFAYLLAFTALISINLAVLNILPFPALDGGRLIVVLLEAITRKRFSKIAIGIIHTVGFLLLILLMVVLSVKDIRALF